MKSNDSRVQSGNLCKSGKAPARLAEVLALEATILFFSVLYICINNVAI
jgi:hypothetical protein